MTDPSRSNQILYIVSHPRGFFKVGRSWNPLMRVGQLRVNFRGIELAWRAAEPLPRCDIAEMSAHNMLIQHRVAGEWFEAPLEIGIAAAERAVEMVRSGDHSLRRQLPYGRDAYQVSRVLVALGLERVTSYRRKGKAR